LFVAENIKYTKRLIEAGIPTELHVYPGAFYGFDLAADAKVAKAFQADAHTAALPGFPAWRVINCRLPAHLQGAVAR